MLPEIVRALKTFSAKRINQARGTPGVAVWQRSFYEHNIRDYDEWTHAHAYINNNPVKWAEDRENPNDKIQQ